MHTNTIKYCVLGTCGAYSNQDRGEAIAELPNVRWSMQADVDRLEAAVAAAEQQVTRHDQELAALEERRRAVQVAAVHGTHAHVSRIKVQHAHARMRG